MGSGASKKSRNGSNLPVPLEKPIQESTEEINIMVDHEIAEEIVDPDVKIIRKALSRLPIYVDASNITKECIKRITVDTEKIVTQQNRTAVNVYVIVDGKCRVMFQDYDKELIETEILEKGSVFGLLPNNSKHCNSNVIIASGETKILRFPRKKLKLEENIEEIVTKSRFFHTVPNSNKKARENLIVSCLESAGTFQKWPRETLELLGRRCDRVWLLPTDAVLFETNENPFPPKLYVLCKGKFRATFESNDHVTLQAWRYPFVIGEENMFTGKKYGFTARALEPSFVLMIPKQLIDYAAAETGINGLKSSNPFVLNASQRCNVEKCRTTISLCLMSHNIR